MFRTAMERGKEQIDYAIDVLKLDGYPPLTLPLTLSALKKMPPEEAVRELQGELRRTMKKDELTGTPVPDNATIKLIHDYMAWSQVEQPFQYPGVNESTTRMEAS